MTQIVTPQAVTPEKVRLALYERGTNLKKWCEEHDFNYATATQALNRHAGGGSRVPWGQKTRNVLKALEVETGLQLLAS